MRQFKSFSKRKLIPCIKKYFFCAKFLKRRTTDDACASSGKKLGTTYTYILPNQPKPECRVATVEWTPFFILYQALQHVHVKVNTCFRVHYLFNF